MKLSRFNIFRLPNKVRRFDYAPRHFDPDQVEREKKRKRLEAEREIGVSSGDGKSINFREGLRNNRAEYRSQATRSNVRIILILGVLFMIVYYLFQKYDIMSMISSGNGAVNQ